eukprot:TRINITY_DN105760_c0_g1_i1.p1 TRINITY_DN105760_c0_g1~~TRINITY_DN105760_c0_g1_i1.p1  ORF type:complete len:107 (+),score=5.05 TRINITY_DN105760_c0_g1_i1:161-481(+)
MERVPIQIMILHRNEYQPAAATVSKAFLGNAIQTGCPVGYTLSFHKQECEIFIECPLFLSFLNFFPFFGRTPNWLVQMSFKIESIAKTCCAPSGSNCPNGVIIVSR